MKYDYPAWDSRSNLNVKGFILYADRPWTRREKLLRLVTWMPGLRRYRPSKVIACIDNLEVE